MFVCTNFVFGVISLSSQVVFCQAMVIICHLCNVEFVVMLKSYCQISCIIVLCLLSSALSKFVLSLFSGWVRSLKITF